MKSLITKFFLTNILAIGPVTLLPAISAGHNIITIPSSYSAMEVKYLGGDNESLFFNVKYENKNGSAFRLLAVDETGEPCFQDDYASKGFEKRIKITRLTDTDYVIFLIRSAKENIQLSYKVKVTTKVVDETFIVKNRELVSYK
jgi:hypothetical protein